MVKALRVDERLIHGQVAMAWTRDLGIQGIMVADDEAASNEMQKMTLKMAVPDGIKCIIKTVPEPGIEYVNIGNAGRFTSGDGTERTIISRSVSLTPDEVEALKELAALAPDTALQMVPSDEKKLVSEVL